MSNESRDHFHEDGYLVPSPRYGVRFETLFVYLGNVTFQQILSFVH